MDQYIGTKLNERYELVSILGVGGMAVVYKAKDLRLNRMVAVKVLKPELAADDDIRSRFHDESRTVCMMNHPNIVNVFDVNQDGDLDYFVMELVDGITLKQYIRKRGGTLNWREALHFAVQILLAMDHAHSKGIIHRDIKPQNVMVLRDGSVKVADFGIARIVDSAQQTMTQEALGSVHYISPEQAKGSAVDARSDIYSAGVVLYEMTTGRLPYEGDSPVAVAVQHINSVPLAPREINPEIPLGMEQITIKMMAPDKDLRYASAAVVLSDLEEFRKNPSIRFDYLFPWMVIHEEPGSADPDQNTVSIKFNPEDLRNAKPPEPEKKEEEPEPEDDGSGKRTALMIGAILLAILLVLFIIFRILFTSFFSDLLDGGKEYTVPNLLGKTYTEAEREIFQSDELFGHFTVTISEEQMYNASYEPGQIIRQEPLGNTTTKSEETEIVVVVNADEEIEAKELIMPAIIGEGYEDWADTLSDKYGVVVKYKSEFSSDYDEGLIIKTDPVSGSTLKEGQTVTVTYSKGPKSTTVTMVSLIGMSENEARAKLAEMGLACGTPVVQESDRPAGQVIFQSVKPNSSVEKNTVVELQISSGPRPEDRPAEPEDHQPEPEVQPETQQPNPEQEWGWNTPDTNEEEGTTEPEVDQGQNMPEDEVYTITVNLPAHEDNSVIMIYVNGENYYTSTVSADQSKVTVDYQGTIEGVYATLDGIETEWVVE
ncbi:MAG: Stk1 family PASTA domain-containing Ser/Thr kinase [Oscillospiraceae bacterium]|nr:Stk1 family PASTA domain-containing Ser/Thr kinase [Oscillospiraceae bacterium]